MKKDRRAVCAFIIYGALMVWLLLFQRLGSGFEDYLRRISQNINYIPFKTIGNFIRLLLKNSAGSAIFRFAVKNLFGNIIMFIPLGVLLPCVCEKARTLWRFLLVQSAVIIGVELIQLFTLLGSCDIDDFILNTAGSLIGFAIYKIKERS